jgi:prepilin-type N-terminal cleavage/methylation domain-containing protein
MLRTLLKRGSANARYSAILISRVEAIKPFKPHLSKGFTLIELLVVIAIIGTLSSVILVSLNSARSKGNDAKVKSQLVGMRVAAEIYYDTNYGYGSAVAGNEAAGSTIGTGCNSNMFASTELSQYTLASNYPSTAAGTGRCTSSGTAYAVTARLNASGAFWCVDSRNISKATSALQGTSVYTCP